MNKLIMSMFLFVLACCISCQQNTLTDPNPDTASEGNSSVSLSFAVPEDVRHLVISAEAVVSAEDMETITAALTVGDGFVTGTIEEIPAGAERKFEIFVYGENGNLTYYGFTYAEVIADQTTEVVIQLEPQQGTGTVIITGTFGDDPGEGNYALEFNGTTHYVLVGDHEELEFWENDFSLSARFKTSESGRQQQLVRKGHDRPTAGEGRWLVKIFSNNRIRVIMDDIYNGGSNAVLVDGTSIVTDGLWHHVAAVFDRDSGLSIYLDGELERFSTSLINHSGPVYNTDELSCYIGRRTEDLDQSFEGLIDYVRIWDHARSHEQVLAEFTGDLGDDPAGLISGWQMDEGGGQIVFDHSGGLDAQLGSEPVEDDNDPSWVPID